ncbi:hypothetical protein GCM10009828_095110 [Actinoplanes couchii]|uniref:Uncharacterized protein n=1 Tax=Actinoplanes couchii TaxID=403638 RepID=A0ABQ3XSQ5_9ACTN|nr:hypothetical protein Aco03nite_099400 [Actinoplanes couchii]
MGVTRQEVIDAADTRPAGDQAFPRRFRVPAQRRDRTHSSDDDVFVGQFVTPFRLGGAVGRTFPNVTLFIRFSSSQ